MVNWPQSSLPLSVQGEHAQECNHWEIIHIEENPESFWPSSTFHPPYTQVLRGQRGLNDLWKARLSCGRMIRLLGCPLTPSHVSKLPLFLSLPVCRRKRGVEGGGRAAWPSINHSISFVRGFRMHGLQPYFFLENRAGFGCSVYNIRQETKV